MSNDEVLHQDLEQQGERRGWFLSFIYSWKITALMRAKGRCINHKRVERIWRQAGLKVPQKQPKKKRLRLNDGSCIRLRPEHRNHVWSYDIVEDRLRNGKKVRWLNLIDEYTKECLASIPKRNWDHRMIIEFLADVMLMNF